MTCAEFQRVLPDYLEQGAEAKFQSHVDGCSACSELVASLRAIVAEAPALQSADEPSPRVWNSIEIALRQEGLIRQPLAHPHGLHLPSFARRWGIAAWLVPAAAAALMAVFVLTNPHSIDHLTRAPQVAGMSAEDVQLLQEMALRAPAMSSAYETNLRSVNQYIRDAQATVEQDPNDEEARRSLMDAYQQKSMLYEIALNRSLQ